MNIKRGKITLENLQVKSEEKAKKLAMALEIIEEECGIHEVEIEFKNLFICPWVDLKNINGSCMENLVSDLLYKLRK
jgi:hypothetical protein